MGEMRKKKKRVRILTICFFFTDGKSNGKMENEWTLAVIPNFQIPPAYLSIILKKNSEEK